MILTTNTLQIEEMMRWADKDGDGVVGVSEFSSLMFDTVRWACRSSPALCSTLSGGHVRVLQLHVRHCQVGMSEFSSLMFDTVRWACRNSTASCSTLSGGHNRVLQPHVQHCQVGITEFSSLMFNTVRWA